MSKHSACYLAVIAIFAVIIFSTDIKVLYSQDGLENESSEEIMERENFIKMRRSGGPGQVLPQFAYELAAQQKSQIQEDRNIQNSITRLTSWVSVNPTGMF